VPLGGNLSAISVAKSPFLRGTFDSVPPLKRGVRGDSLEFAIANLYFSNILLQLTKYLSENLADDFNYC
jgi:hypothetical protein